MHLKLSFKNVFKAPAMKFIKNFKKDTVNTVKSDFKAFDDQFKVVTLDPLTQDPGAEDKHIQVLDAAAHDPTVCSIRPPLGHGVLYDWIQEMRHTGVMSLGDINAILGISCESPVSFIEPVLMASSANSSCSILSSGVSLVPQVKASTASIHDSSISTEFTEDSCDPCILPIVEPGANPAALLRLSGASTMVNTTLLVNKSPPTPHVIGLKDFVPLKELGSGGFATVYMVRHAETGTVCALKAIRRITQEEQLESLEKVKYAAQLTDLAIEEQLAMRRCQGVEGIVQLLGSFVDTLHFYLIMECYTGGDLATELDMCQRIPLARATHFMAQIVLGVEALHNRGIIHRDLKPENILIDAKGHLVIADLGLSRLFKNEARCCDAEKLVYEQHFRSADPGEHEVREVTNTGCGTLEYAAPEVLMNNDYDYKADTFAMGVIFHLMLFGRYIWCEEDYDGEIVQVMKDHVFYFCPMECHTLSITPEARHFIEDTVAFDPKERPTATEMKSHLIFQDTDWDNLKTTEVPSSWISEISTESSTPPPVIPEGMGVPSEEDFPFFTYKSHLLSPVVPAELDAAVTPAVDIATTNPFIGDGESLSVTAIDNEASATSMSSSTPFHAAGPPSSHSAVPYVARESEESLFWMPATGTASVDEFEQHSYGTPQVMAPPASPLSDSSSDDGMSWASDAVYYTPSFVSGSQSPDTTPAPITPLSTLPPSTFTSTLRGPSDLDVLTTSLSGLLQGVDFVGEFQPSSSLVDTRSMDFIDLGAIDRDEPANQSTRVQRFTGQVKEKTSDLEEIGRSPSTGRLTSWMRSAWRRVTRRSD